ncbi:MAG TPA: hypothetical protein VHQ21_07935 [Rhodanobacteraceae bacterium]|nr:hypothetical protein [Rhodanobacteraceae bacterium]
MSETLPERQPIPVESQPEGRSERRHEGVRLLRRLVIYHGVLAACLLLAAILFPEFVHHLPIGGVRQLVEGAGAAPGAHELTSGPAEPDNTEIVLTVTNSLDRLGAARQLITILIGTWLLMLPISWVHKDIHRASAHDHSLDETVLILPGIVAALVLVVQHSLALAFSLAGIVAGVQFRRALQDTFDALFILVAIGTGIAAGVRALEIAAVLTVFFTYSTLYVHYFGDGFESDFLARKKAEKKQRKRKASAKDDDDAD